MFVNVRAIIAFSLTTKCMKYTKYIFETSKWKIYVNTHIVAVIVRVIIEFSLKNKCTKV